MSDHNCEVLATLWVELNPHAQVHGCEIDAAGTVHLWIWYTRNHHQQPLELVLGNPPSAVIRAMKRAIKESGRTGRLRTAQNSTIKSELPGNSTQGQVGGRDK